MVKELPEREPCAYRIKLDWADMTKNREETNREDVEYLVGLQHRILYNVEEYFEWLGPKLKLGYSRKGEHIMNVVGDPENFGSVINLLKEEYNLSRIQIIPLEAVWSYVVGIDEKYLKDKGLAEKLTNLLNNMIEFSIRKGLNPIFFYDDFGTMGVKVPSPLYRVMDSFDDEAYRRFEKDMFDIDYGVSFCKYGGLSLKEIGIIKR